MMKLNPDIKFLLHPSSSPPPAEWEHFEEVITHHRYFHILEDVFKRFSDEMPEKVKTNLKDKYRSQLQKQLILAGEMQHLGARFDQEDLSYITFKGTALAVQLYGNIGGRLTRDLDFHISENDIEKFLEIFREEGYRLPEKERNQPAEYFRKVKKNQTLLHPKKKIIAELHWRMFSNPEFYPQELKLHENPELVQLGNIKLYTMNRINHFLYLCMHGIYHEYFRLFWLRDIPEALEKWKPNPELVLKRAKEAGLERVVDASIILAEELYAKDLHFPGISRDKKTMKIVNHCIRIINRSSLPSNVDRFRRIFYFMSLKRDLKYKLECVAGVGKRYRVR